MYRILDGWRDTAGRLRTWIVTNGDYQFEVARKYQALDLLDILNSR
jgi:hypothetical protein